MLARNSNRYRYRPQYVSRRLSWRALSFFD